MGGKRKRATNALTSETNEGCFKETDNTATGAIYGFVLRDRCVTIVHALSHPVSLLSRRRFVTSLPLHYVVFTRGKAKKPAVKKRRVVESEDEDALERK